MEHTLQLSGSLEPRSGWTADHCALAKALDVVGTRSAFLLLREAFYGGTRFDELRERTGLSESVAAARLRELTEAGLLQRVPYQEEGQRPRQGYGLTEKGADLLPALVGFMQWADRWYPEEVGYVELRHQGCGARVEAELRCAEGHAVRTEELDLARTGRQRARS